MSKKIVPILITLITFTNLNALSAVKFIAANDSYIVSTNGVDINNGGAGSGNEATFMFWVKIPTGYAANQALVFETPTNGAWSFNITGGNLEFRHRPDPAVSYAMSNISLDVWHHVAVVARNYVNAVHYSQTDMYLDGDRVASCDASANCIRGYSHSDTSPIAIGRFYDFPAWSSDSAVSDVRIFNYAVVPGVFTGLNTFVRGDETVMRSIGKSRQYTLTAHDQNQKLRWLLDDDVEGITNTKIRDVSGNGIVATLTNSPVFIQNEYLNYP